jgi:hypothetical protein
MEEDIEAASVTEDNLPGTDSNLEKQTSDHGDIMREV